jgi:hypothetical protein
MPEGDKMRIGKCSDCLFWEKRDTRFWKDWDEKQGICRRYPPDKYGYDNVQPMTYGDTKCGEWVKKDGEK